MRKDIRPVVKVDKLTREVVKEYPSCCEAAAGEGMAKESLHRVCKYRTLSLGEHYLRFADDFDPDEVFENKKNTPVVLRDAKTGKAFWFPSITACSEGLFVGKATVSGAMCRGIRLLSRYDVVYATMRLDPQKVERWRNE